FAVEKGGVYSDMGKYIRKAKVSGELAVMEVSHQSTLGVRTRARALAAAAAKDSSRGYLELRSRRLEKPLPPPSVCKPSKDTPRPNPNPNSEPNPRVSSQKFSSSSIAYSGPLGSVSTRRCSVAAAETPADAEVSFGENILEADALDRWDFFESSPKSNLFDLNHPFPFFHLDPEAIQTPGVFSLFCNESLYVVGLVRKPYFTILGVSHDLILFFSWYVSRYNFDPVNDCPLPGRYEWVKVDF
ncbi:hypothetical protein B296_00025013, partial [Ensete ventricosum]